MPEIHTDSLKLNRLSKGIYVFSGPTNIGIIAIPQGKKYILYLVDSGPDRVFARKVYEECRTIFKNFEIKAIIATHSHADHIGGNSWFKEKTGCKVWATLAEKNGIETPISQSALSTGGFPLPECRTSYYLAEQSFVDRVIFDNEIIQAEGGFSFELIPLPGHYLDMVGVLATGSDGKKVFFAGDGIFGRSMLARYWMPFIFDIKAFKESVARRIQDIRADYFVPSHGAVYDEISTLAEFNLLSTVSNEKCIEKILETPRTWEELLKEFADQNDIPLRLGQYVLVGSTIRSYLTYLYTEGRIRWFFKDNRMLWERKK